MVGGRKGGYHWKHTYILSRDRVNILTVLSQHLVLGSGDLLDGSA